MSLAKFNLNESGNTNFDFPLSDGTPQKIKITAQENLLDVHVHKTVNRPGCGPFNTCDSSGQGFQVNQSAPLDPQGSFSGTFHDFEDRCIQVSCW